MNKSIPLSEKMKWLARFENGETASQIAADVESDPRTVGRGIELARAKRYTDDIWKERILKAIDQHQQSLIEGLKSIDAAITMPPTTLELQTNENDGLLPIRLAGADVFYDKSKGLTCVFKTEESVTWDLLTQHLKQDAVWKDIKVWKKALIDHMRERSALRRRCINTIEKETGIKVMKEKEIKKATDTDFIYYNTVSLFYHVTLNRAVGERDGTNIEENMVIVEDGIIRNGSMGSDLARCPNDLEKCRNDLKSALEKLNTDIVAKPVLQTYEKLRQSISKTRKSIEEITLIDYVNGRCRVCKRLGM